jgi:hypothetical protein
MILQFFDLKRDQVLIFPSKKPIQNLSIRSLCLWGSLFLPDFKRCRFIFLAAVCCCTYHLPVRDHSQLLKEEKKVEFRVCILRINNCRKKAAVARLYG